MTCPMETGEVAGLLAYSSRKLSPATTALLERHVGSCSACREFVAGQQGVWQALDGWEAPAIAVDFDRRLYQRIEQEASWLDRLMRPLRPLLLRKEMPIAAAACLVIAAGLIAERPGAVMPSATSAQVETLQPEQVEHAFDDLQMLSEFSYAVRSDAGEI